MAIRTPEQPKQPGVHVDPVAPPPPPSQPYVDILTAEMDEMQRGAPQPAPQPETPQQVAPPPFDPYAPEYTPPSPEAPVPVTPQTPQQVAPTPETQQYADLQPWDKRYPGINAIIEMYDLKGGSAAQVYKQLVEAGAPDALVSEYIRRNPDLWQEMGWQRIDTVDAQGNQVIRLLTQTQINDIWNAKDDSAKLVKLIEYGIYPQGSTIITDVDAFNEKFGTDISKDMPFATPQLEAWVNQSIRIEPLVNQGIVDIKTGAINTDKLIDSNVTEKQLRDAGFDVPDGYIQQLKEYKSFVKDVLPTMPKDMQDAYNKGLKSGDWEPYNALVDKANEEYKQYQEQQRLLGLASEFERYYEKDVAKALSAEPITVKGDDELRTRGITPDNITAWDVALAEKDLNEFMAEYDKANPNASRDEAAEAIQNSKEYQHYTKVLNIADESPGYDSRVIRDVLTEALSIGDVQTRTFNRKDIEQQYEQQKAISVATFKGDDKELTRLYGLGYFGEGDYANDAYVEARRIVNQQKDIENAVKSGDANKLTNLFNEGAFGNDVLGVTQYKNLVNYVNEGGRELAPITPDDIKGVEKSFGTKEEYTKSILDEQPKLGELAKDFGIALVPIWGTIYHWNNMSGVWKGASIAADALSLIPIIGGVSAAAKVAAGVGRMARATAALRVVPRLVAAEIIAPATAMLHPIETLKAIGSTAKAGAKYLFDPRFMPASSMGTTYGTTRLEVSVLGDPYASQWVRDQLMLNQKAGKVGAKGSVVFGDKVFTLRSGRIMEGGGVAHASSPSVRFVEEPGGFSVIAKTYPEGHPKAGQRIRDSEQGLFVSNTTLERFAEGGSAFGLEKFGKNTPAQRVQLLKDAAETATATGDTAKASKFNKLVSNYNDAIASQSIKMLNKAEVKIISQLNDLSVDEIVTQINTARKKASELYSIGDIEGAQVAMQEALSFERSLQAGRPGYAIFSPEVAVMAVPSDKLFPGAMFKAGLDDIWVISATELKQDKAAKILMEAADAKRLGNDALSGELTKKAHDMMKGGKTGFKKVSTAELELKFPEMTKLPQMKAQYTTQTPSGTKLWIYTNEPYSFKKVLKAKVMAPIDTLVNIFSPAIKVRTIPMTRAQKLAKIEELLANASTSEKSGDAIMAKRLKAESDYLQSTLTNTVKSTKGESTLTRASKVDDATEHLQAARIAEESGDFTSADRLRREAERIAGRKYVQEIVRRQGTVSGLATYARAGGMQRLLRETTPIRDARTTTRRSADGREVRSPERVRESREARIPDTRTARVADARTGDTRTPDARRADVDRTPRTPSDARVPERDASARRSDEARILDTRTPRTPRTTRTPDTPRIPRQGDVPRTPRTPRIPEPRTPRQPRTPEPRIPDTNIARVIDYGDETAATKTRSVPVGSIAWRQGMFWKYIDPKDFARGEKPQTLPRGVTPVGAVKTSLRTPDETIQVIGDDNSRVPDTIRIDKGVVDITISGKGKRIDFTGKGRRTNVGKRIDSTTTGMSVNGVSGDIISDRELQEADEVIRDRVARTQSTKPKAKRKKKSDSWLDDLTSLKGMRY